MPRVGFPAWQPHPDVWLIVGLLVAAYAVAVTRVGPRHVSPGQAVVSRFQMVCFGAGAMAILVASDYPIHDLAERYLFSIHMVQHLVYSLVAAPLLLLGTPAWMARALLSPRGFLRAMRWLARFFPATVLYNAVLVFTHVPATVDVALRYGIAHFALHTLLLVSSIIVWMPILSPLPEVPRLYPPLGMFYLFLQSVVPTVPASFLTFGRTPLYHVYATFPRLWGITALDDMQVAGLIMKIAAGILIWGIITIVFFRWFRREEADSGPLATSRELDRELVRLGMTQS
ncbi:MAG TPA: cytochrome c oxidase assembly protein [Acidimicrobiia bacterium]